jgi:hypothetical protein
LILIVAEEIGLGAKPGLSPLKSVIGAIINRIKAKAKQNPTKNFSIPLLVANCPSLLL